MEMRNICRAVSRATWQRPIALVLALGFAAPAALAEPDFATDLDAALTTILGETGTVGFAVGVIKPGEDDFLKGYGVTRLGTEDPVTKHHIFHWASVSKPFVATAIMQLIEKDKLSLESRLVDVLPDYTVTDPRHKDITIKQLLLHTSGMPDVEDYEWDKPQEDGSALKRWATKGSPRELLTDPGTRRQYSNVGFEVLGAVIAEVSGQTFEDYMMASIFKPLAMDTSTFYYPDVPEEIRTFGHEGETGEKRLTEHYPWNRRHGPSSTLNTSVSDMALFAHALLDSETLLKAATRDEMWAKTWPLNEDGSSAATLGWVAETRYGSSMVRHFGSDDGFRSVLVLVPEAGAAVFVVTHDEGAPLQAITLAAYGTLDN